MSPKVSVCLITYNHENYIRPCLDNILSQQVDFDFEIVIGEDRSTDATPQIIKDYQQHYPEKIRIIDSATNVGMVANWERTLKACKGKYIAIIEGDDCWISNHKLQKQVNMLDANPAYSMCFHGVEVEFGEGIVQENTLGIVYENDRLTIDDVILRNWFIPTCSLMIKGEYLPSFPEWTKKLQAIDLVVELFIAAHGGIGYMDEKMGMYRIHAGGISQVQWLGRANRLQLTFVEIFKGFDAYSKGKYRALINRRLERVYLAIMKQNPPRSSAYLKALAATVALNPKQNMGMIKDWTIINLVPKGMYKLYRSLK